MTRIELEGGGRRIRIKGEETAAELADIAERLWPLTDVPATPPTTTTEGGGLGFHTENAAADDPPGYGLDARPTHPMSDPPA